MTEILVYRLLIAVLLWLWITTLVFWRMTRRLADNHERSLTQEYSRLLTEMHQLRQQRGC